MHNHDHHHGHSHAHDDIGQKNKEHFDNVADSIFNEQWVKDLCEQISNELQTQSEWYGVNKDGREIRMLDYACGNGVVSRALAPFVSSIRGMDISPGMVAQYNKLATGDKMHAVAGNLLSDDNVPEGFANFDLIVMSMALHHVSDPDLMIEKLAERLADSGVLLIVDWVSSAESGCGMPKAPADNPVRHTVSRHGFVEKEVREGFEKAGLGDWGWKWFAERSRLPDELGREHQMFMAKGSKRAAK